MLEHATIEHAAKILADVYPNCSTVPQVVKYLREVLRVLPYESIVISSARDIPVRDPAKLREEERASLDAEWQGFLKGAGREIFAPARTWSAHGEEYTIHVYQKLGGLALRYRLRYLGGRYVTIEKEIMAHHVGDWWGIE